MKNVISKLLGKNYVNKIKNYEIKTNPLKGTTNNIYIWLNKNLNT